MSRQYAMITGASKGIGRAMAVCCGSYGFNMLLVSLPNEHLSGTAAEISMRFNVDVQCLEIDLALGDAPKKLLEWCEAGPFEVNMLINNAGIGYQGGFDEFDSAFYQRLLNTNVVAPALITREFLPMLKRQKQAWVLFSSSFAGFHPMPFKVVYAASKSFITQFSRALYQELKISGIQVSVVCPAGVDSFPESSARIDRSGWIVRSGRLSPEQVAQSAIKGMLRGKRRIIPGKVNVILYYLAKLLPTGFIVQILHRFFCRFSARQDANIELHPVRQQNHAGKSQADAASDLEK